MSVIRPARLTSRDIFGSSFVRGSHRAAVVATSSELVEGDARRSRLRRTPVSPQRCQVAGRILLRLRIACQVQGMPRGRAAACGMRGE